MIPPILVRVSKTPTLAALLPSGAQFPDNQVIFDPVQRKHAVDIKYVAKYCTAGDTSARRIAYPAIPIGAHIIGGRNREPYLSDRVAPMAYTIAPQMPTVFKIKWLVTLSCRNY